MFAAIKKLSRRNTILLFALTIVSGFAMIVYSWMFPPHPYELPLEQLSTWHKEVKMRLEHHVKVLATDIGPRNMNHFPGGMRDAADYVEGQFRDSGMLPWRQEVPTGSLGIAHNIVVDIKPNRRNGERKNEWVVVGAHYDTYRDSPGANDNATGVAALLEFARYIQTQQREVNVRLVAFANEEPPFFKTPQMGSRVLAEGMTRSGKQISMMYSFDSMGFYSFRHGTQSFPPLLSLFYSPVADFISVIGNLKSWEQTQITLDILRNSTGLASGAVALPPHWVNTAESDQWSFWQEGAPALLFTDTAYLRDDSYHTRRDRAERISYDHYTRATTATWQAIAFSIQSPTFSKLAKR